MQKVRKFKALNFFIIALSMILPIVILVIYLSSGSDSQAPKPRQEAIVSPTPVPNYPPEYSASSVPSSASESVGQSEPLPMMGAPDPVRSSGATLVHPDSVQSSDAAPVYNAAISPQAPHDSTKPEQPVLLAGRHTKLRFDIGPRWERTIVPVEQAKADKALIESSDDVPLDVILVCDFCEPQAEALKHTTYRAKYRRADEVSFDLWPNTTPAGMGVLQLGIINGATGREYERLVIDVTIVDEHAVTKSPPSVPKSQAIVETDRRDETSEPLVWAQRSLPVTDPNTSSDVTLYVTQRSDSGVTMRFVPHGKDMRRQLALALDSEGAPRKFHSEIGDKDLVVAMTSSAYGAVSALSKQGLSLERLSSTGADVLVSPTSQLSLELTEDEADRVSRLIARIGRRLYRHMFYDEWRNNDLLAVVRKLEGLAADAPPGHPLRLNIVTDRITVPWQYLYPGEVGPSDKIKPNDFWGFRFSLSVTRIGTRARTVAPLAPLDIPAKIVFAHYGSQRDVTFPMATQQRNLILGLPVPKERLSVWDNGPETINALRKYRGDMTAFIVFLHAASSEQGGDPYLMFNDQDRVESWWLEGLLDEQPLKDEGSRYWARAPLVFLNACETGPSVSLPNVSLENVMFQLGAGGVVVTEVPVWAHLGHYMAMQLIPRLAKGEPVPEALAAVRRQLYIEKRNPLGLLYAYYGDPAATFQY
jgi:hypothetical protein